MTTDTTKAGKFTFPAAYPMPGRDGVRVPLNKFFDTHGRWGYLIENCRVDAAGLHVLYNFVLFPDCFSNKDPGSAAFSDMTSLMARNHEDNLAWLRKHGQKEYRDWRELYGKYEGETLVIASCGPSLTETLPTLYRRRKEFRLMCLNRSMRAFNDPEAKPDFYYFVERRALVDWLHETNMQGQTTGEQIDTSGITMIGTPQCDHRAIRCFDPDLCYWGYTELGSMSHNPDIARLTKYDLKAATTIGNAPFIAWKLGFKKIIFVGCDFSLDCQMSLNPKNDKEKLIEPTRMYFDKAWNQTHYAHNEGWIKGVLPALGIGNRAVEIDPWLSGHRNYFLAVLDILHHDGGVECINASPRGTLFFNCMSLEEALG